MKQLEYNDAWPDSWKISYSYDLLEQRKVSSNLGYSYAYQERHQRTLAVVERLLTPKSKILDVAAGQGNFTLALAEKGYDLTWNDLRAELVDFVKLKYEKGAVGFKPGDIFSLEYENHFDLILATEIIEHTAHPDRFLSKLSKMLIKDGHLIITTPNLQYFRYNLPRFSDCLNPAQYESKQFKPNADGHIFLFDVPEIKLLAHRVGLSVIESDVFANSLTCGHTKLGKVLPLIPYTVVKLTEQFSNCMPSFIGNRLHSAMLVVLKKVV